MRKHPPFFVTGITQLQSRFATCHQIFEESNYIMVSFRDHHTHLVLATLQTCAILGGSLLTAAFMKYRESTGTDRWWCGSFTEGLLTYTRFLGFSFLLIPIIWVFGSIWLERHHSHSHTRTLTLALGSLILVGVIALFYWLVTIAAYPRIISPISA